MTERNIGINPPLSGPTQTLQAPGVQPQIPAPPTDYAGAVQSFLGQLAGVSAQVANVAAQQNRVLFEKTAQEAINQGTQGVEGQVFKLKAVQSLYEDGLAWHDAMEFDLTGLQFNDNEPMAETYARVLDPLTAGRSPDYITAFAKYIKPRIADFHRKRTLEAQKMAFNDLLSTEQQRLATETDPNEIARSMKAVAEVGKAQGVSESASYRALGNAITRNAADMGNIAGVKRMEPYVSPDVYSQTLGAATSAYHARNYNTLAPFYVEHVLGGTQTVEEAVAEIEFRSDPNKPDEENDFSTAQATQLKLLAYSAGGDKFENDLWADLMAGMPPEEASTRIDAAQEKKYISGERARTLRAEIQRKSTMSSGIEKVGRAAMGEAIQIDRDENGIIGFGGALGIFEVDEKDKLIAVVPGKEIQAAQMLEYITKTPGVHKDIANLIGGQAKTTDPRLVEAAWRMFEALTDDQQASVTEQLRNDPRAQAALFKIKYDMTHAVPKNADAQTRAAARDKAVKEIINMGEPPEAESEEEVAEKLQGVAESQAFRWLTWDSPEDVEPPPRGAIRRLQQRQVEIQQMLRWSTNLTETEAGDQARELALQEFKQQWSARRIGSKVLWLNHPNPAKNLGDILKKDIVAHGYNSGDADYILTVARPIFTNGAWVIQDPETGGLLTYPLRGVATLLLSSGEPDKKLSRQERSRIGKAIQGEFDNRAKLIEITRTGSPEDAQEAQDLLLELGW